MHAQINAAPDDIDITVIWKAVKKSLLRVGIFAACAGGLTYLALATMAPQYTSQAELAVVAKGAANPFAGPQGANGGQDALSSRIDKQAINTHVRALMSRDLAMQVIEKFKLNKRSEFNTALGPHDGWARLMRLVGLAKSGSASTERDRVLEEFYGRLQVYSPNDSRVLNISFRSSDPKLAADVPNTLADFYRGRLATQSIDETGQVQKALLPKISNLTRDVAKAEAEVEKFRAKAGLLVGGAKGTPLSAQQLGDLTTELTRASAAKSVAEARAQAAVDLMKRGSANVLPEAQQSRLIQNLTEQRVRVSRQISELSTSLLPQHPRMRQLRADMTGLKRQIASEVKKVVESLQKEAKAAALREASVRRSLETIKTKVAGNSDESAELKRLEGSAASKRAELERLQAQFQANKSRADSGVVPVEAQVLMKAGISRLPTSPRKGAYSALVAFAVFLFGIAIVMTRALLSGARGAASAAKAELAVETARQSPDVATTVDAVIVQSLQSKTPMVSTDGGMQTQSNPLAATPNDDPSGAMDSHGYRCFGGVDGLSQHLVRPAGAAGGLRSLVTGDHVETDIVGSVGELALGLSDRGQSTLVIDWSLSGEGLSREWGLDSGPGLLDLLGGTAKFGDVVHAIPDSQVHIIACGRAQAHGASQLDADQINLVLDALDEAYDQILVVGRQDDARMLFEKIQGRFDAGIMLAGDRASAGPMTGVLPGTFLGFRVADIELIRLRPPVVEAAVEMPPAEVALRDGGQISLQ